MAWILFYRLLSEKSIQKCDKKFSLNKPQTLHQCGKDYTEHQAHKPSWESRQGQNAKGKKVCF